MATIFTATLSHGQRPRRKLRFCKRNINICSALLSKDILMKGCRMEAVARNGCRFGGRNEDYKRTA